MLASCLSILLLAANASPATSREPQILRGMHRIVFLGDSITQAGDYVADVECWCLANSIKRDFVDVGLASETGTDLIGDENAGHTKAFGFGHPMLGDRLLRTLTTTKPDLLFVCYGMNDSDCLPYGQPGLDRFAAAMVKIDEVAKQNGVKRIVFCTPPIFDDRGPVSQNKRDQVLDGYSKWLLGQRKKGWNVVDFHGSLRGALDARRKTDPNFAFAGDGVHPNAEGHWVMAQAIFRDAFGVQVDRIPKAEALFPKNGDDIYKLVKSRQDTLLSAYLTAIGHKRPGVPGGPNTPPGPTIAEATVQAKAVGDQISSLLPKS